MVDNRGRLEAIAGRRVCVSAWLSGDFSRQVARIARESLFDAAFTVNPPDEPLSDDLGRYHVPRVGIYRPGRLRFSIKCSGVDYWRWMLGLINS